MILGVLCFFVLYIDVLSIFMRFSIRFCIYEHIKNRVLQCLPKIFFSEMMGMQNLLSFSFLVDPTALGPSSSCTASETHGN